MPSTLQPQTKKNRILQLFQNNKYCWLAFFCAFGIMVLVFFCYEVIPFGDTTIMRMDLYHQYGPLFAELYDRVTNMQSFLYSWNTGLGSPFFGNFYNYLSSPLSFLVVLFGRNHIWEAIAWILALKASLAAASFTYYLKRSQNANGIAPAAFGILYAFCGYFIAYYWNVMWIDAMYVFPLVVLGIELCIREKKVGLYIAALTYALFSNYYMGYMICIFSVLYFIVYYLSHHSLTESALPVGAAPKPGLWQRLKNSKLLGSGVRFAAASLCAGALMAFILLPLAFVLSNSSATKGSIPTETSFYFNILDFLANHLAAVEPTIRSSGTDVLPNVYCGIATLLLVPLYLFSKSISSKEKIMHVGLLGFLFLSFNVNILNYIWHGFHLPNDLPYRQSFMYSFLLLVLAFKAFTRLREFTSRQLLGTGVALMFGIALIEKVTSKNVDSDTVYISLAFAALYTLVLIMAQSKKLQAGAVAALFLCSVVAEAAIANTDHYVMEWSKESYASDLSDFQDLKAELDAQNDQMYRMELSNLRARMDPAWYNYNGVSTFSSMAYEKLAKLQQCLGMYGNNINSYTYYLQTPIYNMLSSLQYVVNNASTNAPINTQLYSPVTTVGKFEAYSVNYALPIAYSVNEDILKWEHTNLNPFAVQNEYFALSTGIEDVLQPLRHEDILYNNLYEVYFGFENDTYEGLAFEKITNNTSGSMSFTVRPEKGQNVYLMVRCSQLESVDVSRGEVSITQSGDRMHILDIGYCEADEEITIELWFSSDHDYGSFDFYLYGLDMERFTQGYEVLKAGQMQVKTFEETEITGTITTKDKQMVYTSIPYDTSWQVYVDGEQVAQDQIKKIGDALLGITLSAGTHELTFKYVPQGLSVGLGISALTAILLAAVMVFIRRKKRKTPEPVSFEPNTEEHYVDLTALAEELPQQAPPIPQEPPQETPDIDISFYTPEEP